MTANAELQKQLVNYAKTRAVYVEYRKAGYSQKFRSEHEADILIHQAAKKHFDDIGIEKLPSMKTLRENYRLLCHCRKLRAFLSAIMPIKGIALFSSFNLSVCSPGHPDISERAPDSRQPRCLPPHLL